ncbi:hypothetical protein [Bifidobacterium eulemuris]|uniref:Uncharacterized protein n=1 Tax=Bifidobacterium eulemuris TaxID=1765219 RepID=A0A261GA17_9BIFI|nr:hypothetical protein [Bifidobacterium eulemuris]OZG68277.1 hypothetical protein BEUL_1290 [Bifidobacterium eulemuris]QOL31669.1 hypothetical protein BE0216_03725 [Bifidobacterium eulemuris]
MRQSDSDLNVVRVGVETVDLSIREDLDADALVYDMLHRIDFDAAGLPNVVVQSEIDPATESLLLDHDVVLYSCGAPEQPDWNLKAWIWRFTLSLTVLSSDPMRCRRISALLNRRIASWPYEEPTDHGKVGRLVDNPGFRKISAGDMTTSKTITARTSTKLVQAASPTNTTMPA